MFHQAKPPSNQVEELLGAMSPLQAKSSVSDHGSVMSFQAGGKNGSEDSMSIDSASTRRAPLGEVTMVR